MPRLLQINTVENFGSTGKIMQNIGLHAQAEGWVSFVAAGSRYSLPGRIPSYRIVSKLQSQVAAVHTLLTDKHGFSPNLIPSTKSFIRWIEKISPDIIHLHNIHSYILNLEVLFEFLAKYNRPVVWTLHDCWAFTGHCSHYINKGCMKWKTGCGNCPLTHTFPKSLFIDNSAGNYAHKKALFNSVEKLFVTAVSDWLGEQAGMSFLKEKYIGYPIHNGIDTDKFIYQDGTQKRLENAISIDDKILLGVSTDWCRAKGIDDFVELRKLLSSEYKIVLIGMKPDQINHYKDSGLICLPRTENADELIKWYSTADIVLQLSYAETFGLPIAEGYACGTPAVVYDNSALHYIVDDFTGIRVPTGNIDEAAEAVKRICSQGKKNFSANCRELVVEKYNVTKNYQKYIDLYKSLL